LDRLDSHHWLVDMTAIEQQFAPLGFKLSKILSSTEMADVRPYEKVSAVISSG
jgi:hypothetical protein